MSVHLTDITFAFNSFAFFLVALVYNCVFRIYSTSSPSPLSPSQGLAPFMIRRPRPPPVTVPDFLLPWVSFRYQSLSSCLLFIVDIRHSLVCTQVKKISFRCVVLSCTHRPSTRHNRLTPRKYTLSKTKNRTRIHTRACRVD